VCGGGHPARPGGRRRASPGRGRVALASALLLLAAGGDPLELETLSGEPVRIALDAEEVALVVHFWAVWCVECASELPALDRAAQRCPGRGVEVVTVNVGDDPEAISRFLRERPLGLPVLRDPQGDVWRRVVGRGLPANLVVTREGRRTELGPRDAQGWEGLLADLGCARG
jgi:thiol-disulfide isomerase/thioredoxin